jgi:hypothetical protein
MNGTFYQDTPLPASDHLWTPGYTITGQKPLNTLPLLTPESTQRARFERGAVGVPDGTAGAVDGENVPTRSHGVTIALQRVELDARIDCRGRCTSAGNVPTHR